MNKKTNSKNTGNDTTKKLEEYEQYLYQKWYEKLKSIKYQFKDEKDSGLEVAITHTRKEIDRLLSQYVKSVFDSIEIDNNIRTFEDFTKSNKSPLEDLICSVIDEGNYTGLPTAVFTKLLNVKDINNSNFSVKAVGAELNKIIGENIGKQNIYKDGKKAIVRVLDGNVKNWQEIQGSDKLQEDLERAKAEINKTNFRL